MSLVSGKALPVSPFVGFQHEADETLEQFSWWCLLPNGRRTEAHEHDQLNGMRSRQLHDALEKIIKAIREVEAVGETMRV